MKGLIRMTFLCAAVATTAALLAGGAASSSSAAGRYIVVLDDRANASLVAAEHTRRYGARVSHIYTSALHGYAATLPTTALRALERDAHVAFVSPDRPVRATQTLPTGVNRIDGEASSARSGDGVGVVNANVAVIDTGIDVSHPDLNVAGGKDCTGSGSYSDGNGHGTHVAGTIAAKDDAAGVVGVVPGARLWAVRVLDASGAGTTSSVVCGIDWVTAYGPSRGIKVANMSLGGAGADDDNCGNTNGDAEHRAICASVAKGITYVAAAGNEGIDFRNSVPATYGEVLTVTATADFNGVGGGGATPTCLSDVDDTFADFSNFAVLVADRVHSIAAPGVCIRSTWRGATYKTISGTSMAAPHVSGTVALCISSGRCAGLSPPGIISKLRSDASAYTRAHLAYGYRGDPASPVTARYYGYLARAGGY
jgi:subtilisin